jgi:putative transposase
LGQSTVPARRLQAERPNQVWALDFMFDTTADGRPFKVLSMCDEFTRESVRGLLGGSITAADVVAELDRLRLQRAAPEYLRCDNGPEFIAAAIRDWCRFSGTGTSFIDPGSPWQNAYVESFNGKARDELFAREIFDSVLEARVLYQDWRHAYNLHCPHRSLGLQPPAVFVAAFNNQKSHPLWTDQRGPVITSGSISDLGRWKGSGIDSF